MLSSEARDGYRMTSDPLRTISVDELASAVKNPLGTIPVLNNFSEPAAERNALVYSHELASAVGQFLDKYSLTVKFFPAKKEGQWHANLVPKNPLSQVLEKIDAGAPTDSKSLRFSGSIFMVDLAEGPDASPWVAGGKGSSLNDAFVNLVLELRGKHIGLGTPTTDYGAMNERKELMLIPENFPSSMPDYDLSELPISMQEYG